MYELVKKKSKWVRILIGILIFFVVTSILKEIVQMRKVPINEQLVEMVSEINKRAPIMVDSITRFDNMMALPGNKVQYNYTILKYSKSDIDTLALAKETKTYMVNMIKTNPKASFFKENNIELSASYSDSVGVYICTVFIKSDDYK